ncbi:MAG TPA: hypothetical protein ENK44_00445 [Caldithrix abyssi]|uniref:Uncharacterized protein n=1 Tax=Caldithrix abyssi TaxID=187145 RepID=A0A7V4TXV5_CALAY|nr:hypothetical protein [Caldithrix abyssi]
MKILSLKLCGFNSFADETVFQLDQTYNDFVLYGESEKQLKIFQSILGVLFGFTSEEKDSFRDHGGKSKVFTGLITIDLDNRTLLIERDFETDIVASILMSDKKSKPVFQGKDFVDQDDNRAYIHMIRSIFHITDKQVIYDICTSIFEKDALTLSSLVEILELLLGQKLKITYYKRLSHSANSIYESLFENEDTNNREHSALITRGAREQSNHLKQTIEKLNAEIRVFEEIGDKIKRKIEPRVGLLPMDNAQDFKDEVLLWKKLRKNKIDCDQKLKLIRDRRRYLQNLIRNELFIYKKLPDSFEQDIKEYALLTTKLEQEKENFYNLRSRLHENKILTSTLRRRRNVVTIVVTPLVFLLSYFVLGPNWLFIIPETILSFLIIIFYFGHKIYTLKAQYYQEDADYQITQKNIKELEEQRKAIAENAPLVEDIEFSEIHIERFKKYKSVKNEMMRLIQSAEKLEHILSNKMYKDKLPELIRKYASFVDIERDDLETYLDEFLHHNKNLEDLKYLKESKGYAEIDRLKSIYEMIKEGFVSLLDKYDVQLSAEGSDEFSELKMRTSYSG